MRQTRTQKFSCRLIAIVAICGCSAAWGATAPVTYLQDDAVIRGGDVNLFRDGTQDVMVVTGHFSFTVGKRIVSGQKAVVWIRTHSDGRVTQSDIAMVVEGNAKIVDQHSTTSDTFLLVRAHVQGRVTADAGTVRKESLAKMAFYKRAKAILLDEQRVLKQYAQKMKASGRSLPRQDGMTVRTPHRPEPIQTESADATEAGTDDKTPSKPDPTKAPPMDPPAAVTISAPKGITIEKDPTDATRRVVIIQGEPGMPVVISQGTSDSKEFMELRADRAVVYSRELADEDVDERAPYTPPMMGLSGGGDKITGVYLEGDVIIARGERRMTGESAYYDFVEKKALILKPVLRTIQEQRNIPIYVRADEARVVSPTETHFKNAIVSTSDFKTPTYDLGSKKVIFRDETPYDADGEQLGERRTTIEHSHAWFDLRGVPIAWIPPGKRTMEEGHTALRKLMVGKMGNFGWGLETQWQLFRLIGLVAPEGVTAHVNANIYEKGVLFGIEGDYQRQEENRQYSGYFKIDGVYDRDAEDTFGDWRKDLPVGRHERGRVLVRHKEFLPRGWEIQAEISLLSDRNFLEEFYPDEFWTGKRQENLIYAKKQQDNWAVTALLQVRLNDWQDMTDAFPEVEAYLIGEPIFGGNVTYFGEARFGMMRYRGDEDGTAFGRAANSDMMPRFDTRHELNMPLTIDTRIGPLNVTPFLSARFTAWGDMPSSSQQGRMYGPGFVDDRADRTRFFGQLGAKMNMSFHRIYNNVENRMLDVNGIRHIIQPEMIVFSTLEAPTTDPNQLYPLTEEVERHLWRNTGVSFGLYQRWQTKRGEPGNRRTVDWIRLDVVGGWFARRDSNQKGTGEMFYSRPEYSYNRPYINMDFAWNVSDSVVLLADGFADLGSGKIQRANIGLSVQRDPRLSYYVGMRYLDELEDGWTGNLEGSTVATAGFNYRINKKYTVSVFEQYDFKYRGGTNLGTRVSIVRKFPRWYAGITFIYNSRYEGDDDVTMMLNLWPEGAPEAQMGGGRDSLLYQSSDN